MPYKYWSKHIVISYLQRLVIVHSIIYYELNENCISDSEYDKLSRKLVSIQKSVDKEELKKTMYYYVMYDFDGSTGFDIPGRLTKTDKEYLTKIAYFVLKNKVVESNV